jgi:hypothetical protein
VLGACSLLNAQGPTPPDCGPYTVHQVQPGGDYLCRRIGVAPWFAGIPGQWETELWFSAGASPGFRFTFISSPSLSSSSYDYNLLTTKGILESLDTDMSQGQLFAAGISGSCSGLRCSPPSPATGALIVIADAADKSALAPANGWAVLKAFSSDGTVASQSAIPVIFHDEATARWRAPIDVSSPGTRALPGATITSFAVANLSPTPQAVVIRLFDENGQLIGSGKTPSLAGAVSAWPFEQPWVGGVYADVLSNVVTSPGCSCTLTLEGENGGKIAPAVFRFTGASFTSIPAKAY